MPRWAACAASALALGAAPVAYASTPLSGTEQSLRLPAGPMAAALENVAVSFDLKILYDPRLVSGLRAPTLQGRMTAEQALARLLDAQSLHWRRTSWDVVVIGRGPTAGQEPEAFELEQVVVSASRTPQPPSQVSSSVGVITPTDLREQQFDDLRNVLGGQPGVAVANTGNVGGTTAVYIRGAYPHHTLLVIDGIRMNDRAASYDAFMGGAGAADFARIEVLRGPQSPLYGGSAIGGVVLANTPQGDAEAPSAMLSVSAGSFDTAGARAVASGGRGAFSYRLSLAALRTDNDLPSNGYRSQDYSARLQYAASSDLNLGVTFRGMEGEYQSAGSRYLHAPGVTTAANYLGTAYADWRASGLVSSRLRLGLHRREYDWASPTVASSQVNSRVVLDWQAAIKPSEALEVVAGSNLERSAYDIDADRSRDRIVSGFLSANWRVAPTLTVNAGVRRDDYRSVGAAVTWRTGFAWNLDAATKVRGTWGTAFAAPGSSDRYGVSAWKQLPNPDIRPETSQGWDIGLDRTVLDGAGLLTVSYFGNEFRSLIDWRYIDPTAETGQYFNRSRASTRGVELGLALRPPGPWRAQLGYTYLEARDDDSGLRLPRRPRHAADLSIWNRPSDRLTLGAGAHHVARRPDGAGDYTTVRAFVSYALDRRVTVDVRVENLFDAEYDEVDGYAGLSRGVHARLAWTF